MFEELKEPIMNLMGTAIIGAISITIVLTQRRIVNWFLSNVWSKLSYKYKHGKLKQSEIEKDTKIREILIELRAIVKADRTGLFQFHNGNTFTTNNPIWKVSNTHESVSPGISSEIGKLQDIKASCLIETLQSFWGDAFVNGVEKLSPEYCGDCPNKSSPHNRKVIFINVSKLEDSYSRSLLMEQGIKYVLDVPIFNNDENCVGFVAVNYCSEQDEEVVKAICHDICRNASQIQFLLLQEKH